MELSERNTADETVGVYRRSFDLSVCPVLQRLFERHAQLLTNIDMALSKESVWAHMARRESSARRARFDARSFFGPPPTPPRP